MKYGSYIIVVMLLTLCAIITGCQTKEEKIQDKVLSYMEDTYNEEFEVVKDSTYNKTYGCYEFGLQSEGTKDGLAIEVDYYPRNGLWEGYYANMYLLEVTREFQSKLDLSCENYVYSQYYATNMLLSEKDKQNSYEKFKEFSDVDDVTVIINLYCEDDKDIAIAKKVSDIVSRLDKSELDVCIYFVHKDDILDIKDYVTTHYARIYDSDSHLLDRYDYEYRVVKREDKGVSIING